MELTITEEDFDSMTSEDIPSIARRNYTCLDYHRNHLSSLYRWNDSVFIYVIIA